VLLTGYDNTVTSTVDSFIANLPEMLGSMAVDPRRLVAIAEFDDERYVQFWVEPHDLVIAEVISNLYICDALALSEDDEECLRSMGWSEPAPGPRPNWRFEAHDVVELLKLVEISGRAVFEVLGERPSNRVTLRTWAMELDVNNKYRAVREVAPVHYQSALRELRERLDD
jgi:hypothetical protein